MSIWTCTACETSNDAGQLVCAVCAAARARGEPSPAVPVVARTAAPEREHQGHPASPPAPATVSPAGPARRPSRVVAVVLGLVMALSVGVGIGLATTRDRSISDDQVATRDALAPSADRSPSSSGADAVPVDGGEVVDPERPEVPVVSASTIAGAGSSSAAGSGPSVTTTSAAQSTVSPERGGSPGTANGAARFVDPDHRVDFPVPTGFQVTREFDGSYAEWSDGAVTLAYVVLADQSVADAIARAEERRRRGSVTYAPPANANTSVDGRYVVAL